MKLNLFNNEKLPMKTRKLFSPSPDFTQQTKGRFLAAFGAHYPAGRTSMSFSFLLKAAVGVVAILAVVMSGVSVYADTKNVPADSILYPWKRIGESVQLSLATAQAKPQLEANIATRRANEITDLEDRHPSSTLIPQLANDLGVAINDSINTSITANANIKISNRKKSHPTSTVIAAAATSTATSTSSTISAVIKSGQNDQDDDDVELKGVCNTIQAFLGSSSSLIRKQLANNKALQKYEDHCTNLHDFNNGQSGNNGTTTTTSTIMASSSVSSTIGIVGTSTTSTATSTKKHSNPLDDLIKKVTGNQGEN